MDSSESFTEMMKQALGLLAGFGKGLHGVGGTIVGPAIATEVADAHVEPNGRIEAGLLGEHQVGEFIAEVLCVGRRGKVTVSEAPIGNAIDHTVDKLADGEFAIGRTHLAMEVFRDDDVGGGLRPIGRDFHIVLLKDDLPLRIGDGGDALLPGHLVIRGLALRKFRGEVPGEMHPLALFDREAPLHAIDSTGEIYCQLSHVFPASSSLMFRTRLPFRRDKPERNRTLPAGICWYRDEVDRRRSRRRDN